jgi:hypothetical protein
MKKQEIVDFYNYLKKLPKLKISISQELVDWLMINTSVSELEALEILDYNFIKITKIITKDIDFHKSRYTFPKFEFAPYDNDILIQAYLNQDSKHVEISIKIEWGSSMKDLLKSLSWREFELLARQILLQNELRDIVITKATNDQGIDFFGYYKYPNTRYIKRLPNELIFRVVGQVKHSSSDSGVDHAKISSFGTEILKLRKMNNSSYFQNLDEKFLTSPYPVIGIFITNSYYPRKSIDFANEYGIVFWDGTQISQDLATPEIINKIRNANGTLALDKLVDLIHERI